MRERADLALMGWPFRPDLLRERLDAFELTHPDVRVVHEQALRRYASRALDALARTSPVDVVQVREGLGGTWLAAGALRPLGTEAELQETVEAMWPHARAATVHDGEVVGLPYYSDVMVLVYNKRLLERVGVPVPSTLEQLSEASAFAARRRIAEFPISLNLAPKAFANLPWWGLVYASGGAMQRPDGPDPIALAVLEWMHAAIAEHRIVDPSFLQSTYEALALEKHVFAIAGAYTLKRLNSGAPGTFAMAPIPGIDGPAGTVAWTPFYAAGAGSARPTRAVDLVQFLGGRDESGDFGSARYWLFREGLIPAYPSVLAQAEVRREIDAWVDPDRLAAILLGARPIEGQWAPWFLPWEHALHDQVLAAIFGRSGANEALAAVHARALALSAAAAN